MTTYDTSFNQRKCLVGISPRPSMCHGCVLAPSTGIEDPHRSDVVDHTILGRKLANDHQVKRGLEISQKQPPKR